MHIVGSRWEDLDHNLHHLPFNPPSGNTQSRWKQGVCKEVQHHRSLSVAASFLSWHLHFITFLSFLLILFLQPRPRKPLCPLRPHEPQTTPAPNLDGSVFSPPSQRSPCAAGGGVFPAAPAPCPPQPSWKLKGVGAFPPQRVLSWCHRELAMQGAPPFCNNHLSPVVAHQLKPQPLNYSSLTVR